MTDTLLGAVIALLAAVIALLFWLIRQSRKQHEELLGWLNDYATMVGEFFDSWRNRHDN